MTTYNSVSNGSKHKQIYKCGWLWQTGYYAKTKQKGERGMREGWEYKKLGDCFPYIKNGANIKQIKGADGLPITRIETLSGGVFNRDRMGYAGIYNLDKYSDYVLEDGDLLLSHINSKTYIGRTVEYRAKNGETIIHGMNLLRLKSNSDVINSSFFAYYTLSNEFNTNVAKVRKDAVNQSSIAISDIRKFSIPVPPIQSQQYVVDELDKINELIRLKKEQLKDYDNLAQSIFYEMFGDPVVNEKGWEVKKLIETVVLECTISYGIVQPGDGVEDGIPVVRPIDLTGTFVSTNNLKKTTEKISSSYSRTILTGKELLVCVRGTTGVCSLVTDELKGCNVTRGITPLLFNDNTDRWFMYYQFQMPQIKCIIADYTKGITLKQINMADFRKIPVILPPLPLQQLYAQRIELIEKQKAEIQSTIADLETLLASRMQYWFD